MIELRPDSVIDGARSRLGDSIRRLIAGSDEPVRVATGADTGLFGPGSATWAVHSDVAGLVGGLRALLVQTLHPLVMAGVADHSVYRHDPLGRLHRTGAFIGTTTFGTTAEARAAIDRVGDVHEKVVGTTPDGRPYAANDPHLLAWVHDTEVDSFLRARMRYGAEPLAPGDDDRYVAEMARIARRLGAEDPPEDRAELRTRLRAFRPELEVNHQTREAIRFLAWPPTPLATRAPYGVVFGAAVGLLPGFARRMLRLPMAPLVDPLVIRPTATVLLRGIGWALGSHPAHGAGGS